MLLLFFPGQGIVAGGVISGTKGSLLIAYQPDDDHSDDDDLDGVPLTRPADPAEMDSDSDDDDLDGVPMTAPAPVPANAPRSTAKMSKW